MRAIIKQMLDSGHIDLSAYNRICNRINKM